MRLFPLLLFAALASGIVLAQQVQPQPVRGAEAPKTARIEGVVVSLTGGPVPRAAVRLTGQPIVVNGSAGPGASYGATTDEAGKFAIENIDPGRN